MTCYYRCQAPCTVAPCTVAHGRTCRETPRAQPRGQVNHDPGTGFFPVFWFLRGSGHRLAALAFKSSTVQHMSDSLHAGRHRTIEYEKHICAGHWQRHHSALLHSPLLLRVPIMHHFACKATTHYLLVQQLFIFIYIASSPPHWRPLVCRHGASGGHPAIA